MIRAVLPKQVESRSLEIQAKIQLDGRRLETNKILDKVRGESIEAYEVLKSVLLEYE